MERKKFHLAIILLLGTTLIIEPTQFFEDNKFIDLQKSQYSFNNIKNSGQINPPRLHTKNSGQAEKNRINISITVPLLQSFSLFSLNKRLTAKIMINTSIEQTSLDYYTILMPLVSVLNIPQTIQQQIYREGPITRMNFVVPSELKNFTMELSKEYSIWTIFYRSYTILFPFVISCNIPVVISYELRVVLLSRSKFLSGYPAVEGLPDLTNFSSIEQDKNGQTIFKANDFFSTLRVAWEPKYWGRNALLISGVLVGILILLFLTPGQLKRRSKLQKISTGFGLIVAVKNKIVEKIINRSTTNTHTKLLITLCMIMVAIPLTIGEDPRTNILVLASVPVETELEQIASQTSDMIHIYSIADERNDLPTISRLQFFDAVIIGDFDMNLIPMDQPPSEIHALMYIKTKIVLDQYKSSNLAKWVQETYNIKLVSGQIELSQELNNLVSRNKARLGWDSYVQFIRIEAALSLIITILLVSTIVVYLMENNDETLQTNLVKTIIIVLFGYSFIQSVFFTVSRMLIPLSTHAGGGGITAISYLGPFGGGSMPRMACAMFGFIFAFAFAGKKYNIELNWKLFLAFVITGFALIVDPVTGGRFVWSFLLDMTGGAELTQQSTSVISSFEDYIAGVLGSDTIGFYRSRGIMLFFAGTIPLLVLGRARKHTVTSLLFVCTILTGWGSMRIGQMLAYHFFASIFPGLFFGLIIALLFMGLSIIEEKIGDRFLMKIL